MVSITEEQFSLIKWIVEQINEGNLSEEFFVTWYPYDRIDIHYDNMEKEFSGQIPKNCTPLKFDALQAAGLVISDSEGTNVGLFGRLFLITGEAFELVEGRNTVQQIGVILNLFKLKDLLKKHFDKDNMRDLCLQLNIEYEDLSDSGKKSAVALGLIDEIKRQNRLVDLLVALTDRRSNVNWNSVIEIN